MAKLSVLIPSRQEKYLNQTIRDCFTKAQGEIEVVVCLDGYWPADWKQITDTYPNLHTIHHGEPRGMRAGINACAASAISRGTKWLMKADAHVMFDEGFDVKLLETIEPNWIVVPRRKRLDAENWQLQDVGKPDIDYHYLSFPDDPADFGGKGLNGKVWEQRARERKDILVDDEMSSQGSLWLTSAAYFQELELMDEASYGPFWNEMQECALKAWLSGGALKVNKGTWYAHLHKGKNYEGTTGQKGRGYKLPESWLQQGRTFTLNWVWNEAWSKQTLPFSWLVEHFWPVPSWPENWEEVLYGQRKPRVVTGVGSSESSDSSITRDSGHSDMAGLKIHSAYYEASANPDDVIDVTSRVRELVQGNSLDIVVNNSTLTPGQNPFRGRRKFLRVAYSIDGGEPVVVGRAEKDWLIIGPVQELPHVAGYSGSRLRELETARLISKRDSREDNVQVDIRVENRVPAQVQEVRQLITPKTAAALNDYLIRKFQISDRRLRGPMPIELRDFHRNDLAQLFAELGFKRGAEIGVAEGHYSEILLKANPDLELLLVDPWRRYDGNPYAHSQEHQDFSLNETRRKTAPYPNVRIMQDFSMNAVREVEENSLDFTYVDAHHGFDWVMQDLIEWGKRVRSGGIISGDDYYHFKRHWAGVIEAVNAYTQARRVSPWFLIDAPRSVDFFWVKV